LRFIQLCTTTLPCCKSCTLAIFQKKFEKYIYTPANEFVVLFLREDTAVSIPRHFKHEVVCPHAKFLIRRTATLLL